MGSRRACGAKQACGWRFAPSSALPQSVSRALSQPLGVDPPSSGRLFLGIRKSSHSSEALALCVLDGTAYDRHDPTERAKVLAGQGVHEIFMNAAGMDRGDTNDLGVASLGQHQVDATPIPHECTAMFTTRRAR